MFVLITRGLMVLLIFSHLKQEFYYKSKEFPLSEPFMILGRYKEN